MLFACWAAKGGSGTTVVAASLALALARSHRPGVLLVDLAGDVPAALGCPGHDGPGLAEWLADAAAPASRLADAEIGVGDHLRVLARGQGSLAHPHRHDALVAALASERRPVVVDCGSSPTAARGLGCTLASQATHSLLVTRLCFLGLRRAVTAPLRPSGVIVVAEAGRALRVADVEATVCAPVVAEVPYDASVARCVDAGLLATRPPRPLARAMRSLLA